MKALLALMLGAALLAPVSAAATANAAGLLVLRGTTSDGDGRITLGDLFANAGAASNVQVGTRSGPTAVLDAGIVQAMAARAGVYWDNPRGLRRIIVTAGPDGGAGQALPQSANIGASAAASSPSGWPQTASAAYGPASGPVVVKRDDSVAVTWSANGLSLTMSGQAEKDGAVGDLIQIQNTSSKKSIDAVITGPGTAVAGPAADTLRSHMLLSSR
ncbi:flagellar basal body P-ring formation chaperone FlgA [Asticcacaulis sp. EMRT-3]|uniref:flagellar basal body P-ring formation chaperone FlgA n=1 Tax=Asticcacaulis sp. EMRT-3 TaxID=3040349 RepID=UPI0024AF8A17|nr:flagellar basal body P-ring formation chaperone FlgA [Asticcacaulis sp. EMRT-3]MDI7773797.1 flagellar basal body P-ring formation chaperone FlgA [Asticcacaulis sp. EMRT-3]